MQSVINGHYPQVHISKGQAVLWNPVLKKRFAMRPEERVRLALTDYLLERVAWPAARIGFELPVRQYDATTRADLVLYDSGFKPWMLVECKAPDVQVHEKTAVQAMQYNRTVGAPVVMLTNGLRDVFMSDGAVTGLPDELQPGPAERTAEYWASRGFITGVRPDWLPGLISLWYGGNFAVQYNEIPVKGYHLADQHTGVSIWQSVIYGWNRNGLITWDLNCATAEVRYTGNRETRHVPVGDTIPQRGTPEGYRTWWVERVREYLTVS